MERSLVRFLVRAHVWVGGLVSGEGMYKRQLMNVSHIDVSLPLFLPPFPSLESIKKQASKQKKTRIFPYIIKVQNKKNSKLNIDTVLLPNHHP